MQLDNAGQPASAIARTAEMVQVPTLLLGSHNHPKPYSLLSATSKLKVQVDKPSILANTISTTKA